LDTKKWWISAASTPEACAMARIVVPSNPFAPKSEREASRMSWRLLVGPARRPLRFFGAGMT
jgi:hypothetical protein